MNICSENQVKLTAEHLEQSVNLDVNYKWEYGDIRLETMVDSEFTAVQILEKNYDGFKLLFNCSAVSNRNIITIYLSEILMKHCSFIA